MDELDRRLLRALQHDAARSNTALAQEVGASPASCWRRIQALETTGVLRGLVRLVDPQQVDRGVNVMCQVRMRTHDEEARQAFERFVRSHTAVMECHAMSGEWDYQMRVVVADVAQYERFLMRELLRHPAVATAASHFALSQVKYTTAVPV